MKGSYITPCTLTVKEAAELVGCSIYTIRRNLPSLVWRQIKHPILINQESLIAWVNSKTYQPKKTRSSQPKNTKSSKKAEDVICYPDDERLEALADAILARNYSPTA
ncbi:MAG: helix-turn-helix domain-containing protein [Spirochaetia bacterium]|nr:helix-turn-helix domain-containing protein [Spirochaetia bacterium]MBR0318930.1 helix-turn-helix domain-containing protein [Spirochaetia bacterium]